MSELGTFVYDVIGCGFFLFFSVGRSIFFFILRSASTFCVGRGTKGGGSGGGRWSCSLLSRSGAKRASERVEDFGFIVFLMYFDRLYCNELVIYFYY